MESPKDDTFVLLLTLYFLFQSFEILIDEEKYVFFIGILSVDGQ